MSEGGLGLTVKPNCTLLKFELSVCINNRNSQNSPTDCDPLKTFLLLGALSFLTTMIKVLPCCLVGGTLAKKNTTSILMYLEDSLP